jgi:hypothetical protein
VNIIKTAIRVFAVTILYFVCFAVISGALLAPASEQSAPAETGATLLALFLVSLINAAVWSYVIFRSRWTSGRLILTIFFIFFGVSTVMPQIESAYFITRLPPGMLPRLFLAGLIMAATFAPLAVLILGKAKRSTNETLPLACEVIVDCRCLRRSLFHFRLLYRVEESGSAGLLRWKRSGRLHLSHNKSGT